MRKTSERIAALLLERIVIETRSIFIQKYFLLFLKSLSHISHLDMQATQGPLKGFFIYLGIATTC